MGARLILRWIVRVGVSALAAAPLSVVTTLLLLPVWRWLEATTGIESIGHSGPAAWCYGASFLAWLAMLIVVGSRITKRAPDERT